MALLRIISYPAVLIAAGPYLCRLELSKKI